MVTRRSVLLEMVRAAMMPGTAQAKLDSRGMKARPCKPTPPMMAVHQEGHPSHVPGVLKSQG